MKSYTGSLDRVSNSAVKGWVMVKDSEEVVNVSLVVNDKQIATQPAINFRKDLLNKNIHSNGNCGFEFQLPTSALYFDKKNKVQVLVEDSDYEVRNSPNEFYYEDFLQNNRRKIEQQLTDGIHKVLLVGMPKSGTSILIYTVGELYDKKVLHFEPKGNRGLGDIEFHQQIVDVKKNVITKSLFLPNLDHEIPVISNFYNKKVWIYRDPRDWLLSEFFYCWFKGHNPNEELFYQSLKLVEEKEKNPTAIPFYKILSLRPEFKQGRYDKWIKKLVDELDALTEDWYLLKYEDFVDEHYEGLNQYLGKELIAQSKVPQRLNRVVRTKKYGNWRRWFNQEDVAFFKPIYQKYLDKLGYDGNDWELTPQESLSPEEGSKYMRKVFGIA